ncbi:hypothetical protein [Natronococcus occultus]|uniref:Uncharacterized protein n=1 Tax=Natronococcus occultus SP4 TaxID=694430 RepID=L0K4P2_9EURY|nr:hypothetical protein [Natronococcus occultus]AGB39083.1 hypothetical protein Natoc_3350 [Natronococcus occultus SP4]
MRLRTLYGEQSNRRPLATERSIGARAVGLAIVGVGAVLVADAVGRRLESSGPSAVADSVRRRRGKSTPRGPDRTADGDEPIDDERLNADMTAEPRSTEVVDERATDEVQTEPATPGEMTVDEDVAEKLRGG